jgi:hypothetical protein
MAIIIRTIVDTSYPTINIEDLNYLGLARMHIEDHQEVPPT